MHFFCVSAIRALMETFLLQFLVTFLSVLAFLTCVVSLYKSHKSKTIHGPVPPPQAEGCWPIIGHLHLFHKDQLMHHTLSSMADQYGPIFTIKLGAQTALVLSSWEAAKECLTVHDKAFSNRPSITVMRLLGYNSAMFGVAPYGPYWREIRKIVMVELLSSAQLDRLKDLRASEIKKAIKELYEYFTRAKGGSCAVEMKQWLGNSILNVSVRMAGGGEQQWHGTGETCRRLMRSYFDLFGAFVLSDVIPILGWWDMNGTKRKMKELFKTLDTLVGGWLEDHKRKRLLRKEGAQSEDDGKDFIDVLMETLEREKIKDFDTDTIIKATCLNILFGGSDTILVALTWALSLLLNNRDALTKVQDELDAHVGRARLVDESDINNLVYLQAVIKEALRLYPPLPFISYRVSTEDVTFSTLGSASYRVPAGTRLMMNLSKVQRDERVWSDPDEFKPERFLTTHKDVSMRGQSFELLPFGAGRRMCPGDNLGLSIVHLTLASLLQCFHVCTSGNEAVDMTGTAGLVNLKASPLEVLVTPRLDPKLYEI